MSRFCFLTDGWCGFPKLRNTEHLNCYFCGFIRVSVPFVTGGKLSVLSFLSFFLNNLFRLILFTERSLFPICSVTNFKHPIGFFCFVCGGGNKSFRFVFGYDPSSFSFPFLLYSWPPPRNKQIRAEGILFQIVNHDKAACFSRERLWKKKQKDKVERTPPLML